jgi:hypothetical protein
MEYSTIDKYHNDSLEEIISFLLKKETELVNKFFPDINPENIGEEVFGIIIKMRVRLLVSIFSCFLYKTKRENKIINLYKVLDLIFSKTTERLKEKDAIDSSDFLDFMECKFGESKDNGENSTKETSININVH